MVVATQAKMFKIPAAKYATPNKFYPLKRPSLSIVRPPWKGISAPLKHAESDGNPPLLARLLVLEPQAQTVKIPPSKNFAQTSFSH
jgi:hypothetical protein